MEAYHYQLYEFTNTTTHIKVLRLKEEAYDCMLSAIS